MLICVASSKKVPFISVLHFSNGTQFLNTTCAIPLSAISPVSAAFILLTVISFN